MRRWVFALMALAFVLVVAGIVLRPGDDDDRPTGTASQAAPVTNTGPPPPIPAACQALDPVRTLLLATVSDVEHALNAGDDADLVASIGRATDRRATS